MKKRFFAFVLTTILVFSFASCAAQSVPLLIDGKDASSYHIVIADDADFDIRYAAYRLQKLLIDRYGTEIPVVTDISERVGREILLGNTSRPESERLAMNEYNIKIENGNLVLNSGHYTGICVALDYLENFLKEQGQTARIGKKFTYVGTISENLPLTWNSDGSAEKLLGVPAVTEPYRLVWNDEFDGDKLDYEKWSGFSNMKMNQTTLIFDERTVRVAAGSLYLIADITDAEARTYISNYSVTTQDTMNFSGGYLEMRARVPFYGMGEWPSWWSNSARSVLYQKAYRDAHNGELYPSGYVAEVDFFEVFSSRNTLLPTLHKWFHGWIMDEYGMENDIMIYNTDAGKSVNRVNREYYFYSSGDKKASEVARDWHTYGFLWTEELMAFSVDGVFYYSYPMTDDKGSEWFNPSCVSAKNGELRKFGMDGYAYDNMALSIILNNMLFTEEYSANNSWASAYSVKAQNDDVFFPLVYEIDYMRLYQKEGDRLYTPERIGKGTAMFDEARYRYELYGEK